MKKFVFVLAVLLLAAPAQAVDVWCVADGCDVTVKFSGAVDIRAFAIDIELDSDGGFSNVLCLSDQFGYQIYPGDIDIDDQGNVDDWGSCKCSGSYAGTLDDNNSMTIEMGSLYEDTDPDPCESGDLVSFRVTGNTFINVDLELNQIRGGVVNEAAGEESPSIADCNVDNSPDECMKGSHPDYAEWDAVGKPDCWCYARQCKGDADGKMEFGVFWVYADDLAVLKAGFAQGSLPAGTECADFAHDIEFGVFRVYANDLAILKANFAVGGVTECDSTDFNFWVTPP